MIAKWELYLIAALLTCAACLASYFYGHYEGTMETKTEYAAAALKQANESREAEQAERDKYQAGAIDYERQISQLKLDAVAKPAKSCWVPKPATADVSEASATSTRPEPTSANGPARETGEYLDVGSALKAEAYDCKAIAMRLNKVLELWPR